MQIHMTSDRPLRRGEYELVLAREGHDRELGTRRVTARTHGPVHRLGEIMTLVNIPLHQFRSIIHVFSSAVLARGQINTLQLTRISQWTWSVWY